MPLAPTVQEILDQKTLRWVFVGGKGGVGKTTNSCALALQLAQRHKSVLLISTDPAHNVSDAFNQKFGKDPRPVTGVSNLSAMEIDPTAVMQEYFESQKQAQQAAEGAFAGIGDFVQDLAMSIPGIDEALGFAEVMKLVKRQDHEVVVFDTAPTGHTLRFLQFPAILEKALNKLQDMTAKFGPLLNTLVPGQGEMVDSMRTKLGETLSIVQEVQAQFQNPDLTTFVCVCIAEFLSLYETERMIQELSSFGIDTNTIIVNQLLFPDKDNECKQCNARYGLQQKYLEQYRELYDDFHLVEIPQLTNEVRGLQSLQEFSKMQVNPTHN